MPCSINSQRGVWLIPASRYSCAFHLAANVSHSAMLFGFGVGPGVMVLSILSTELAFGSNAGHCGNPGAFGSPFVAKFTQYWEMVRASWRSVSVQGHSGGTKLPNT